MELYFVLLIPLVFLLFFECIIRTYKISIASEIENDIENYRGSRIFFWLFSFFNIMFLGLRGLTGSDTPTYQYFYDTNMYPNTIEKGYAWFSNFFANSGVSFTLFEVVVAVLTLLPIFYIYYKYTTSMAITLLFFYLDGTMLNAINISRQMLAVSFFFLGVFAIIRRRSKLNLLLTVICFSIAVEFHKTAWIAILGLIPIYLIYIAFRRRKNSTYICAVILLCAIVFFYKSNYVYNYLLSLGGTSALNTYGGYVTDVSAENLLTSRNIRTLLTTIIEVGVFLVPQSKHSRTDKLTQFLLAIFAFSVLIQSTQINWISDRFNQFFVPFLAILIPKLIVDGEKINLKKAILFILFLVAAILQFYRMVVHNFGTIYPYIGI